MLRRPAHLAAALLATAPLALAAPAGAAWRAPVPGRVVGRFAVVPDRFAAGQRRGVDLAAPPGALVVAPCSGRVAFAGALPARGSGSGSGAASGGGSDGVSIRCGPLTATVLGLAAPAPNVRAGASVARGDPLGRAGPSGRIRLGARRTADRFGYRDPLALLGREGGAPPRVAPGPVPPAARDERRGPPARPPSVGAPRAPAAASRAPAVAPPARAVPLVAWLGLALVAVALPAGTVLRPGRSRPRGQQAAVNAK